MKKVIFKLGNEISEMSEEDAQLLLDELMVFIATPRATEFTVNLPLTQEEPWKSQENSSDWRG